MVSALTAMSNQGLCTGLQIASAVETPLEGWVVLPGPAAPAQCLPAEGVRRVTQALQGHGTPFWEYTGRGLDKTGPVTWYLAGTLSNWSGTPLSIVVVLEEPSPALAQMIGRKVLQSTIQP
jgi:hypothetical protein